MKVSDNVKICAVIVAAGNSSRMKSGGNSKLLMPIDGETVLGRTLSAFEEAECIDEIVIVTRECDVEAVREVAAGLHKPVRIALGGDTRQESVSNGVALCADADYIAVHDGARPMITPGLIERVCSDAEAYGAATLAVPVKDTIKLASADGFVADTPEREKLRAIQTPQVFYLPLYKKALSIAENAGKQYTDDCQLIENAGGKVYLTMGDYRNIKITTPEDIAVAETFYRERSAEK